MKIKENKHKEKNKSIMYINLILIFLLSLTFIFETIIKIKFISIILFFISLIIYLFMLNYLFNNKEKMVPKSFKKGLFFKLLILLLLIFLIFLKIGYSSVILDQDRNTGFTKIECLGTNNYIYFYDKSDNLIYKNRCDIHISVKNQILEQSNKLIIKNLPETDEDPIINYEEQLNTISDEDIPIKMELFSDKVCFTISLPRFSDVRIENNIDQQVKDYYKCFSREELTNEDNTIEVYVNDRLIKEFNIEKPDTDITISFTDLEFIDTKLKNYINIKFNNPAKTTLKVNVIDTNLNCNKKSFIMSDTYSLLCNKTKNSIYYIQIKDSKNRIYYKQYQKPPELKKDNKTNFYIFVGIIVIAFFVYINYKRRVEERDKKAIDQLEEEDTN